MCGGHEMSSAITRLAYSTGHSWCLRNVTFWLWFFFSEGDDYDPAEGWWADGEESSLARLGISKGQSGVTNRNRKFFSTVLVTFKNSFVKMSCRDSIWVIGENPMDSEAWRLQSIGLQRVKHDWSDWAQHLFISSSWYLVYEPHLQHEQSNCDAAISWRVLLRTP